FTNYTERAIVRALERSPKECKAWQAMGRRTVALDHRDGEDRAHSGWADQRAESPVRRAVNRELLGILREVSRRLPENRRAIAELLIEHLAGTGKRLTFKDIAAARGISEERARNLAREAFDGIAHEIEISYPHLAKAGVRGWEGIMEVYPRTVNRARE